MYFPKLSLLILLPLLSVETLKADRILLRNGSEIECTIKLVNDTDVKYLVKRNDQLLSASTSDIYMLKYDKRGNVYITSDCKRITGSDREIPKGADVVYLVKGEELPAFNLSVLSNTISFYDQKPSKKRVFGRLTYAREDVFKIVYRDGSMDIITRLDFPEPISVENAEKTNVEPVYKAVIHKVSKKETLGDVASRYKVQLKDIIDWNNLDVNASETSSLKEGSQLMIYVLPI